MKVGAESEVAGDVVSEQRQFRHIGAVGDGERARGVGAVLGERPRFAAKREAAEVELVAGGVAANRRVECRQVVERQIACAGERISCPLVTSPEIPAYPPEMVRPSFTEPPEETVKAPPLWTVSA